MRTFGLVLLVLSLMLVAACGDDDDDDEGNGGATETSDEGEGGNPTPVAVTLQEFAVLADPDSGPSGSFNFAIENIGPDDPHELVVIKTELDPGDLPTSDDGSVDEEGEGIEVVDEVEDIPVDGTETLSLNLDAGKYALICNIVEEEEGETEAHYAEGMRIGFTVE